MRTSITNESKLYCNVIGKRNYRFFRLILSTFFLSSVLVKCQLDIEELLQAQQRLNGGGGGSGMGRMIGNSIRRSFVNTALVQAVKFVVGQSATPSPEMMQYGMAMRSEPRNQAERNVYLEMMKTVARRTPEVLMKYMKTEVHKNGTRNYYIDFVALDAAITRRSLLYQEMREARRREQQARREQELQHQMEVAKLNTLQDIRMNRQFGLGVTTDTYFFDSFGPTTPLIDVNLLGNVGIPTTTPSAPSDSSVGSNKAAAGQQKTPIKQASVDKNTETLSLLDLMKVHRQSG